MNRIIKILSLLLLASCGSDDDFYYVTKIVRLPDTVFVNRQFPVKLVLRNDSSSTMQLTIDYTVQKSVHFSLDFECDGHLLRTDVENPSKKTHNYTTFELGKGDSIVYFLNGLLREKGNNLQMEIQGYDRIYYLQKPTCNYFSIDFGGMWIPGKTSFVDAMEGYYFRNKVVVAGND